MTTLAIVLQAAAEAAFVGALFIIPALVPKKAKNAINRWFSGLGL